MDCTLAWQWILVERPAGSNARGTHKEAAQPVGPHYPRKLQDVQKAAQTQNKRDPLEFDIKLNHKFACSLTDRTYA
eukprot:1160978-Pelagomonas_calceolata.AAC.12